MERLFEFIRELGETDAQPLVNTLAVMLVVFGVIAGARAYAATLPYNYKVQCQAPSDARSRVVLSSRRTGLVTDGPVADSRGKASVTSDWNFDYYDITLEGHPCKHVGAK